MRRLLTLRSPAARPLRTRGWRVAPLAARALSTLPEGVEALGMPALSPTMTSGTISAWLKKEGEEIQAGEVLCQVETDKAVVDYEMTDDAVLAKIVRPDGAADVPVGATLAFTVPDMDAYQSLLASGALSSLAADEATGEAAPMAAAGAPSTSAADAAATAGAPTADGARVPLIKFLGKRELLPESYWTDLESHSPTPPPTPEAKPAAAAPSAAPTAALGATAAATADAEFEDIALSNMRKIIAKRLTASKVEVPHHYASVDCEIDRIMALRKTLKSAHGVKVSLNDFILKAVALALRDVPEANCHFDAASKTVKPNASIDISVAVATAAGLITPIVPKVDAKGLSGINGVFMELVGRARANKLKPEEFQGGSFTISNLGGFGIDGFTAVVNPPQACIMAIGRGRREVLPPTTLTEGVAPEPRVATLMSVTLSSDRRVVDDVVAGQFLQVFKTYMESPELLAL